MKRESWEARVKRRYRRKTFLNMLLLIIARSSVQSMLKRDFYVFVK